MEAKNYLEKCIENLNAARQTTSAAKAKESIELQLRFYEKQLSLMNIKKDKCEKLQKENEETIKFDVNEQIENATELQLDLLRNLSMVEKALDELEKTNHNNNLTEIHQLNSQFNVLLFKLFNFVDQTTRENVQLKERKHEDEIKFPPCIDNQQSSENKVQEVVCDQIVTSSSSPAEEEEEEVRDLPPLQTFDFDLDK